MAAMKCSNCNTLFIFIVVGNVNVIFSRPNWKHVLNVSIYPLKVGLYCLCSNQTNRVERERDPGGKGTESCEVKETFFYQGKRAKQWGETDSVGETQGRRGKQLSLETFIDFFPSSIARDWSVRRGQQINSERGGLREREKWENKLLWKDMTIGYTRL